MDIIPDFFQHRKRANLLKVIFPHHLQRVEMFAVQRSDENELERKFLPACFASGVEHRLIRILTDFYLCAYSEPITYSILFTSNSATWQVIFVELNHPVPITVTFLQGRTRLSHRPSPCNLRIYFKLSLRKTKLRLFLLLGRIDYHSADAKFSISDVRNSWFCLFFFFWFENLSNFPATTFLPPQIPINSAT